jgi:hypothetical protein
MSIQTNAKAVIAADSNATNCAAKAEDHKRRDNDAEYPGRREYSRVEGIQNGGQSQQTDSDEPAERAGQKPPRGGSRTAF